jgi:predicted DNA-binding transcriptional regulator AlpA
MTLTYKQRFNRKYGQPKDQSNSLSDIAKLTGIKRSALQKIYNKGTGAFKTNPASVRPGVGKQAWSISRVYSAVMGGKAARVDAKELAEGRKK